MIMSDFLLIMFESRRNIWLQIRIWVFVAVRGKVFSRVFDENDQQYNAHRYPCEQFRSLSTSLFLMCDDTRVKTYDFDITK